MSSCSNRSMESLRGAFSEGVLRQGLQTKPMAHHDASTRAVELSWRPNNISIRADRRNRRDALLLAFDDFRDKALAVKIAVLVERDVQQHPRCIFRGYFGAMQ